MRERLVVKVGGSLLDWVGLPAGLDELIRELQDWEEDKPRHGPTDEVSACECEPPTPTLPHKGGGRQSEGTEGRETDRRNGGLFSSPKRLVIVVGGGLAADFVRGLDRVHRLGEEVSHRLALHALDLSAEALARLVPGLAVAETLEDLPAIWDSGRSPVLAPRRVLEADERCASPAGPGALVERDERHDLGPGGPVDRGVRAVAAQKRGRARGHRPGIGECPGTGRSRVSRRGRPPAGRVGPEPARPERRHDATRHPDTGIRAVGRVPGRHAPCVQVRP